MKVLIDIELSFSPEEMLKLTKAAELKKKTPQEYVYQTIMASISRDLKRTKNADRKPIKRIS